MNYEIYNSDYCQSCGMPLRFDVEEYLGTNADHTPSHEYCYYCLKDGKYVVDIPMEEMVDIWVKYTGKYNEYAGTKYTPSELRTLLNKRLPTLKRWKQKLTTRNVHQEAVRKIKNYISQNLFSPINPLHLCETSHLSLYHFRKIFKDITGENIGSYIQRLRLEYVAHHLLFTSLSIIDILKQTNYQTKHSLSKAFKNHFGLSMTDYRKRYQYYSKTNEPWSYLPLTIPQVRRLPAFRALCYPVENAYLNKDHYRAVWHKIVRYREKYGNHDEKPQYISISMDNPLITPPEKCRFYLGTLTEGESGVKGGFSEIEIPGGLFAVFRHSGNYSFLPELYRYIHEQWLPQSNYMRRSPMSFEHYLNNPKNTEPAALLTEIYIPVDKKY